MDLLVMNCWYLLVIFFFTGDFAQGQKEIKMGILLPMTGYWPIGTRIAGSIPLAVHDVISNPSLLPGYNISYRIHNSCCIDEHGIRGMVDFKDMDIIIGPACSTVMEPVSLLCKIWDKPIITYAASATKFTDKTKFSTLSTITAYGRRNVEYTTPFLKRLMNVFNWTVCGILSSSEVEWKNLANVLRDTFLKAKIRVPLFENFYKEMNKEVFLEKAKERVRVILLLAYIKDITEFMTLAKRLGMTDGSYAFLTIDLNTDEFYTNGTWTGHEGPGTKFDEVLDGILDLSVQRPVLTKSFMDRYKGTISVLPKEIQAQLIPDISWYAAFLYDSIWLAARALDSTIKRGYNINNTSVVVDKIFNMNFTGESGKVVLCKGNRVPNFVLGNLQKGTHKTILNNSQEISDKLLYKALGFVAWPGGQTKVPWSTPKCGFSDELCKDQPKSHFRNYILVICLAIIGCSVVLGVLLFLRKRYLVKDSTYKKWLIIYKDLIEYNDQPDVAGNQRAPSRIHKMDSLETVSSLSKEGDPSCLSRPKFNTALYQGKKVYVKHLYHDIINVTRQVKTEIRQACELRHVNINRYFGVSIEPLDICVISEYCTKGRLQDILFDDYLNLDWNFKMSFAIDIARGMEELHKSPVSYHGSLKSTNIVVDSYWICKVADFGLQTWKPTGNQTALLAEGKYSELLWTAPEQLRLTAGLEQTHAGDVYSYGIVLQEIVLREKPYSTYLLGAKEIIHHVKKGIAPHCRPNVPPDSAPAAFRELMTMCWHDIPERRPTFSGVLKMLKKINKGKATNIVDNMLSMMGKYTNNLESLVKDRTQQLEHEKAKTDELLYKMMPKSIADKLKTGSQMKAESYDHVTIFFGQIVDFTYIAHQSTPRQVISLLNDIDSLYDTVIGRYDVFKVMTVGDSHMVVSGLPVKNGKQHAAKIALMSLHLLFYFKEFKIQHLVNEKLEFKMAIHTGPCVAGIIGIKTPRYDVFGETVTIVKHLEATGIPQNIHISERCKSFLEELGGFTYEKRNEKLVCKDLGEMTTYLLTGKASQNKVNGVVS